MRPRSSESDLVFTLHSQARAKNEGIFGVFEFDNGFTRNI